MGPFVIVAALAASSTLQLPRLVATPAGGTPYGAAAAGIAFVQATVSETGAVTDVRAIKVVEPFTAPFAAAVGAWKADPARRGDTAVSCPLLVVGVFRPAMLRYPAPPQPQPRSFGIPAGLPRPNRWSVPPYPPTALGDAAVVVEVTVGSDGSVSAARVTASTPGFDDAALSAAREWAFEPAVRDGRPVPSLVAIAFYFRAPH